jgi:biopolymer transport protein ExbD
MRRFSDRHSLTTLSEINVTPLLDLAFVLLIIFIITTPLMEKSVDLVIPSSNAAQNAVDPSAVVTISINRDEVIKLGDEEISIEELAARLAALHDAKPETAVVVRAHKDLHVQKLIDVMDVLKRAQITKIGVVTNPEAD